MIAFAGIFAAVILGAWLLTELSYAAERKVARMVAEWERHEAAERLFGAWDMHHEETHR